MAPKSLATNIPKIWDGIQKGQGPKSLGKVVAQWKTVNGVTWDALQVYTGERKVYYEFLALVDKINDHLKERAGYHAEQIYNDIKSRKFWLPSDIDKVESQKEEIETAMCTINAGWVKEPNEKLNHFGRVLILIYEARVSLIDSGLFGVDVPLVEPDEEGVIEKRIQEELDIKRAEIVQQQNADQLIVEQQPTQNPKPLHLVEIAPQMMYAVPVGWLPEQQWMPEQQWITPPQFEGYQSVGPMIPERMDPETPKDPMCTDATYIEEKALTLIDQMWYNRGVEISYRKAVEMRLQGM